MTEQIAEMANVIANKTTLSIIEATGVAEILTVDGYRKQREGENITEMHPVDEFICSECGLIMRDCCRYEIDADDGDEICYEFAFRFCPRCGAKMKGGVDNGKQNN